MRRIDGGSDLKKIKKFENRDFFVIFGSWARLGLGIPPREPLRHSATAARHDSPRGAGGAPSQVGRRGRFRCARRCPGVSRERPAGPRGSQDGPQAHHESMYKI